MLERVVRALDRSLPAGDAWHRELLFQAMTADPGVRPPILPRELHRELLELLGFRHFIRHGYGLELDPARLRANLERMVAVVPAVGAALDALDRFQSEAIAALEGGG